VVVHAAAEEGQLVLGGDVARGEVAQVGVDVLLGGAGRQVERVVQTQVGGDDGEEVLDVLHADRGEHRLAVGVGHGGVGRHQPSGG
jgi:hypothetical protein